MVDEPKITLKVKLDNIFQMISNKVTSWSQTPSDDKYPSEKLVKDSLDGKASSSHTHSDLSQLIQNNGQEISELNDTIDSLEDVAFTGDYNDLTNKPSYTPTITSSTTGAYKIGSIDVNGFDVDIYGKDIDTVYTHPTYSNVAKSTSAIYKFKTNSLGHIIEISTVSASDLPSHNHDDRYYTETEIDTALGGKAPTSHASSSTTYGVATSSNYGHTKVINNLTTSSNNNGEALSAYQGKVLNDGKVDKNDFNVDYVYSFVYNSSIEKYAYQGQSGAVGIGISAMDENDNSLLNEDGVAIIDLVFQNTNINYGSIQLVLAEANGRSYSYSGELSNTQTIATITDTDKHHITIVVSSDTHIEEGSYDYYDLKVSKISYDGSNITVSSGKTNMEEVGVYLVFNGAIGGNIEYMNVIKRTPIVNQIIDIIYPIGSTYISVNSVNPSFLFGGEWEQIQDKFLLASGSTYSAGSTGGSATVSLTQSQMPRHTHIQNSHNHTQKPHQHELSGSKTGGLTSGAYLRAGDGTTRDNKKTDSATATNQSTTATNKYTGGTGSSESASNGSAHENMPPYLTVYMWKRIG